MLREIFFSLLVVLLSVPVTAQVESSVFQRFPETDRKGKYYSSWGWNEDRYTKSDIRFVGADYDFTLFDVKATQRQAKFTVDQFLNPLTVSIPQFNFRLGFYITKDIDIFIGLDHMKYVVSERQVVGIEGYIRNSETIHDGEYDNEEKVIRDDFLDYEHTDGLNYVFIGAGKSQTFVAYKGLTLGAYETVSIGVMRPRSDVTLLGRPRHDEYNVAGVAFAVSGGLELGFLRHFFVQSELKGGYTSMPWVRTTDNPADQAKQSFWFGQAIVQFGGRWSFSKD